MQVEIQIVSFICVCVQ